MALRHALQDGVSAVVEGLRRMAGMNRTAIPGGLADRLDRVAGDADAVRDLGVEVATDLCRRLQAAGAPGVHLYTLNRAASVQRIWPTIETMAPSTLSMPQSSRSPRISGRKSVSRRISSTMSLRIWPARSVSSL